MTDAVSSRSARSTTEGAAPAVSGRLVLVAGATSASGLAAIRALSGEGARVVAIGRDAAKLAALASAVPAPAPAAAESGSIAAEPGSTAPEPAPTVPAATSTVPEPAPAVPAATPTVPELVEGSRHLDELSDREEGLATEICDLTDESAVAALAERIHERHGRVDGILHLVGGWRGGGGLAGQTDDDYRFLERSLTALRHVSRAFDADLRASDAARLAIVSSTAVARPLAGGANYAAVKAASEAWARAVAQGFAKGARDRGDALRAASVVFRVTALSGLEQTLADAFVALWDADAADVNDTVIDLSAAGR